MIATTEANRRMPGARGYRLLGLAMLLLVALSFSACRISLVQQAQPQVSVSSKGISAPLKITRDLSGATLVLIDVTIDGQGPYPFALDTGASVSLIDSDLSRVLGLPRDGSASQVSGVGGTQQVVPVRVHTWNAGSIRLPAATLASAQVPEAQRSSGMRGLLGSDVLSQFGSFLLDYSNARLTIFQQIASLPAANMRRPA